MGERKGRTARLRLANLGLRWIILVMEQLAVTGLSSIPGCSSTWVSRQCLLQSKDRRLAARYLRIEYLTVHLSRLPKTLEVVHQYLTAML